MRTVRPVRLAAIAVILLASFAQTHIGAQQPRPGGDIRILPLRGNIFMLVGGGANIVASVGRDGVLLVDTGAAEMSEKVVAAIRELSRQVTSSPMPQQSCIGIVHCAWWDGSRFLGTTASPPAPRPIAGIINTSFDPDHMGGNAAIVKAGSSFGARIGEGAWVIAHENAPAHVPASSPLPQAALPTETYLGTDKKLNFFNGEGVVIWHRPASHTDGDSVVQFRGSEVLAVGDIVNMAGYPVIDTAKGGSVQGIVDSLNWILDMAIVEHMMEGGTLIVPGHGRVTDSADIAYYRDMMTIVRDRVQEMIKRGMTLPQIKAARLTRDYDPRFARNPSWTPDMFVEAVYRSLTSKAAKE
ncbi:MAG TPA: MBL fold metallo-hydrolase [Terriglobia bacterium]|nr:MBL fold metallo-hydrolase [Terriglobia bacterium]